MSEQGDCWHDKKSKFMRSKLKKPLCEPCHDFKLKSEPKKDCKKNKNSTNLTSGNGRNVDEPSTSSNVEVNITNGVTSAELGVGKVDFSDRDIHCGSCKKLLNKPPDKSYCSILQDHYVESFLDKSSEHLAYVKVKFAFRRGQLYWCKTCILVFEKPWSLFQHMLDKAKSCKVQTLNKKRHEEWLYTVGGLMAAYDLELFNLDKVKTDLRQLITAQITREEEVEAVAYAAAIVMQMHNPTALQPQVNPALNGNSGRKQHKEMMRIVKQLNQHMREKGMSGINWDQVNRIVRNTVNSNMSGAPNHSMASSTPNRPTQAYTEIQATSMTPSTCNGYVQAYYNMQSSSIAPSTCNCCTQAYNDIQLALIAPSTYNNCTQAYNDIQGARMAHSTFNGYTQSYSNIQASKIVPSTRDSYTQTPDDTEATETVPITFNGTIHGSPNDEQTVDDKQVIKMALITLSDKMHGSPNDEQTGDDKQVTKMAPSNSNEYVQCSPNDEQTADDKQVTKMAPSNSNIQVSSNKNNIETSGQGPNQINSEPKQKSKNKRTKNKRKRQLNRQKQ